MAAMDFLHPSLSAPSLELASVSRSSRSESPHFPVRGLDPPIDMPQGAPHHRRRNLRQQLACLFQADGTCSATCVVRLRDSLATPQVACWRLSTKKDVGRHKFVCTEVHATDTPVLKVGPWTSTCTLMGVKTKRGRGRARARGFTTPCRSRYTNRGMATHGGGVRPFGRQPHVSSRL